MCEWKAITKRPMTDEEIQEFNERAEYEITKDEAFIYENLPEDLAQVLVCTKHGYISIDTFCEDYDGCYFEDAGDMETYIAWMPLPEPYEEANR